VPEVWIVDLPAEVIEVYRGPTASSYEQVERAGRGGAVAPTAFPDLVLSVDAVLGVTAA
jgi:Uma2 family endonuclease